MATIETLRSDHLPALYPLHARAVPHAAGVSYEAFTEAHNPLFGWIVRNGGPGMVGCLTLTHVLPGFSAVLHGFVLPEHHGGWLSRAILRRVSESVFGGLGLQRLSSYALEGVTDQAAAFLERIGFRREGTIRRGHALPCGNFADLHLYGLLREECRWYEGGGG